MPLHPRLAQLVAATAHLPKTHELPIDLAREGFRKRLALLPKPTEQLGEVRTFSVPGPGGPIAVRSYSPVEAGALPLVVYFHGGGFVVGDLDTHDGTCHRLAARTPCKVLAVDYRLAPEHPFPAPLDDCWAALRWASANAGALGAGADDLFVAGDSAGGALAAGVAMRARDEGGPQIRGQVLIYPVADHPSAPYASQAEMATGYGLTREGMAWYWDRYLSGVATIDPLAAPMRAANKAGLPCALVLTAEYDVLRDEGEAYAGALRAAGVEVQATRYDGMNHGFVGLLGVIDGADRALAEVSSWLRAHRAR